MPAPPSNRYAAGNPGGGRPTKYDPDSHPERAFRLSLLGLTDEQIAVAFGISESTLNLWKTQHEEFLGALNDGKDEADAKVADSLYRRALGYSHEAVKIVADAKSGDVVQVPYVEHYPPDTTAGIFWLKNRHSGKWRDRHNVTIDDPDEVLSKVLGVKKEELP